MPLGDFSPSNMPKLLASLERAFPDSRVGQRQGNLPYHHGLSLIKEQETATWQSVRPNDRACEEFDVTWLEESDTQATTTTGVTNIHRPECAITGEQLQSAKQSYKVDTSIKIGVTIKDEDCGNMYDTNSKVQLALLQGQKKLLKKLAGHIPAWINGYAGVNLANGIAFEGNISAAGTPATVSEIAAADLNYEDIGTYLGIASQFNEFNDPFVLDGGLFYKSYLDAAKTQGTPAGDKGQANYLSQFRFENDTYNFNKSSLINKAFFIERGVLALPIVSFFPRLGEGNEVVANKYIYSVPLAGVQLGGQPVYIDITYTLAEEQLGSTGRCQLVHTFMLELKTKLWLAPKYTSDTNTGIITFQKAA